MDEWMERERERERERKRGREKEREREREERERERRHTRVYFWRRSSAAAIDKRKTDRQTDGER
jgi:hypothetical protein